MRLRTPQFRFHHNPSSDLLRLLLLGFAAAEDVAPGLRAPAKDMVLKAVSVSAVAGLSAAVHGLSEAVAVAGMSATAEVAHAEVATPAGLATGAGDDADAAAAAADMMKPLAMTPELFRPRATTPELARPELATAELATADVMKPMPMSQRLHSYCW